MLFKREKKIYINTEGILNENNIMKEMQVLRIKRISLHSSFLQTMFKKALLFAALFADVNSFRSNRVLPV